MALAELDVEKVDYITQTLKNQANELRGTTPNLKMVSVTLNNLKTDYGAAANATQKADFQSLIDELNAQLEAAKMTDLP